MYTTCVVWQMFAGSRDNEMTKGRWAAPWLTMLLVEHESFQPT